MADEQYTWLNRDTAERLLRGEPLECADADARDRAGRLAEVLGALGAEPALSSTELPGEADALAAFRKARTGQKGERTAPGHRDRPHSAASLDAGLIRLGRPGVGCRASSWWGRRMRFGLAAALAAGVIGGTTAVGMSGLLPFGGGDPEPAASVSVGATPKRPLLSPSPDATRGGRPQDPRPDGDTGGQTGDGPSAQNSQGSQGSGDTRDETPGRGNSASGGGSDDTREEARSRARWNEMTSACRDVRDSRNLDPHRRRRLEEAAHGAGHVRQYCAGGLRQSKGQGGTRSEKNGTGVDDSNGNNGKGNNGKGNDGKGD